MQWYKSDSARLEKERDAFKKHPDFVEQHKENGDIYWIGTVHVSQYKLENKVITIDSGLKSLLIKIVLPHNYPYANPQIEDVNQVLIKRSCPHLYLDGEKSYLCFTINLPGESCLDFVNTHTSSVAIAKAQEFLWKQFVWEQRGKWPGEVAHGRNAYIEYEYLNGRINPDSPCPCGLNGLQYGVCHQKDIEAKINGVRKYLTSRLGKHYKLKLGRNSRCPCGSNVKYKKCCLLKKISFGERKIFIQCLNFSTIQHLRKVLSEVDHILITKKMFKLI